MEKKKKKASKIASAKMHLSYISRLVIVENKKVQERTCIEIQ